MTSEPLSGKVLEMLQVAASDALPAWISAEMQSL